MTSGWVGYVPALAGLLALGLLSLAAWANERQVKARRRQAAEDKASRDTEDRTALPSARVEAVTTAIGGGVREFIIVDPDDAGPGTTFASIDVR